MKTLISLLLSLICASAWSQCSPIVIDTRRDGIELGPAGRGVSFDVNADGFPDRVQWVRPGGDEAFLTLDRNRNGVVDDGSELFGVGTPLLASNALKSRSRSGRSRSALRMLRVSGCRRA